MNWQDWQVEKKLKHFIDALRPVPARNIDAAAHGKANFLKQAEILRASAPLKPEREQKRSSIPATSSSPMKWRHPSWNILIASLLALVIFFSGTGATVYAAQSSLPDESLYPVKLFSEDALLSLTPSAEGKLDLVLVFADRRASEMANLHAKGRPISQSVADRFSSEMDQALKLAAGMDDLSMNQALKQIQTKAALQSQIMTKLLAGSPADQAILFAYTQSQQQLHLIEMGKGNPQGFRFQVLQNSQNKHGTPENGNPGMGPGNPKNTPVPGGGTNNGTGQGEGQPPDNPGSQGPDAQHPNQTHQPNGSDNIPGGFKPTKTPKPHNPGGNTNQTP